MELFLIKNDWVDGSREGPSWSWWTMLNSVVPYLCNFFCCSPHYPRRQVGQTVIGTTVRRGSSFQNTSTLKSGYWDRLSELHDKTAARTVVDTTDRHKPPYWIWLSELCDEPAGRTVIDTTGRHKLRNPDWVGFLLKVLKGCFGLFMTIIMELVG